MTFQLRGNGGNCNGCEWVAAEGEITSETPGRFEEFLGKHGAVYHIALNSLGGNLFAGIQLGELIRESGATTWVASSTPSPSISGPNNYETGPGACASACVFAFIGGVERISGADSRLGVHQFYQIGGQATATSEDIQKIAGLILLHTLRMGIDPSVMAAASLTPPEQMYWFSVEEKRRYGLDTAEPWFDPWSIEPYRNGLILTTVYHESARRSANITVFCRDRGDWFVLISEHSDHLAGAEILQIQGPVRNRPRLRIGDNTVEIDARNIEFQRWQGSRAFVSIRTESRLADQAGKTIAFDPDLPRYKGSFLAFRMDLPSADWLAVARRNCI